MGWMKEIASTLAEEWLSINRLDDTDENWEKAMNWVTSHTIEDCRKYIKENYYKCQGV